MCYVVAKKFNRVGCIALKSEHSSDYAEWKSNLGRKIGYDTIQLVTISDPEAYREYSPYQFVDTREDFEEEVLKMLS